MHVQISNFASCLSFSMNVAPIISSLNHSECASVWSQLAPERRILVGNGARHPLLHGHGETTRTTTVSRSRKRERVRTLASSSDRKDGASAPVNDDLDLAIFRFTLGIPGFDDGDLPRVLSVVFVGFLILNHFLSPGIATPAQWRSEFIGLFLAAAAYVVPDVGRRLKAAVSGQVGVDLSEQRQVFALRNTLSEFEKQELAWLSYALLTNTNSSSLLVCRHGHVDIARGCWDRNSEPASRGSGGAIEKQALLDTLEAQIESMEENIRDLRDGSSGEKGTVHIMNKIDFVIWKFIPTNIKTLLIYSLKKDSDSQSSAPSFILLASSAGGAYRAKDKAWLCALGDKLGGI